ncbi:NAD(P)-binding protein [Coniophora puteana RWD-64-598 SS2]|uniref:NAD(P)-binding protein n=1 Tax=Coniophora puteana (strain RWD-64-598) TaxID=741705 RepID=A0A5M3N2Q0_CONPW|nr:NAD(P)-binding protein [Coniophora puteana RWD-64-598 SS2]EIW85557.1 NAD(P)-binding protein [Coniophora puteana RWD-64-598 SS2]
MSNATYTSFAIFGAGGQIGKFITEALVAKGANILILTRPSSKTSAAPGTQLERVDYTDVGAVAAAFKKHRVEVVVSAVGLEPQALDSQETIARAAAQAGVQLFVPSEYGNPTYGAKEGLWGKKSRVVELLKELKMPFLCLYAGVFTEYLPGLLCVDSGKCLIAGEGKTPFSTTSMSEIGGYLAFVLTTLPPSQLSDRFLRIEGDRGSLHDFAVRLFADKVPVVEHVAVLPAASAPHAEFLAFLHREFDSGSGDSRWDCVSGKRIEGAEGNHNALWEGHKWRDAREVLGL